MFNDYSQYIFKSRYARWRNDDKRRETWPETVHRYVAFFEDRFAGMFHEEVWQALNDAILKMEVLPSMRALTTAGEALRRDESAGYNCSFGTVDDQRMFDEAMYLSMCGTGVGFSVEQALVSKLPGIAEAFYSTDTTIHVMDSRIGWATSTRQLISLLYGGLIPKWDLSKLRVKGAVLKTFGGRASGPEPLDRFFKFAVNMFQRSAGRKLTTLDCHDMLCMIGDIVQSGGVRRSAMLSLSDLSDERMRYAKSGAWWNEHKFRANANNSAVYTEKPDLGAFMREWLSLYESKSGERGIFNRAAATRQAVLTGRREHDGQAYGTNPCGEIILRPQGFCNLTEVVVRPTDTFDDLKRKVTLATILGTFQSTLTNFRYIRKEWKKNAEEERLLGVSMTGIMDHPVLWNGPEDWLVALRHQAVETNKEWADKLGINQSVAVTCVKPSGTVSQLVGSASGIHPRYAPFFIRAVREDAKSPVSEFMKAEGVPWEPDLTKPSDVNVFYFPMASPAGVKYRDDVSAVEQLEIYLRFRKHWCEHNPSNTVYVRENEWLGVADWVYNHFNDLCGVSFLPYSDHAYQQAPYNEITEKKYHECVALMPKVDWSKLAEFETEDHTTVGHEAACSAGQCEL